MPYSSLVCCSFIPVESLRVGRLVLDKNEPCKYYLDPITSIEAKLSEECYLLGEKDGESTPGKKFIQFLTQLTSTALTQQRNIPVKVTADVAKTYKLKDIDLWFKDACKDEETQKWIEDMNLGKETVYAIVGYHTLSNVSCHEEDVVSTEQQDLGDTLSAEQSPEHVLAPAPGSVKSGNTPGNRQNISGENICAIQYGKVNLKSLGKLDSTTINQKGLWGSHQQVRGANKTMRDLLDAEIREDLEIEDDLEKYTSENQGIFLVQK